ncbi:MAG: 1-acyl-sn-glycerol-3-phosphate acyltransferase [Firmicutes bacterium]|nr:1-acyl-sn-glycerol-3-phosphate acyltransferase [Bacillota bacterium]
MHTFRVVIYRIMRVFARLYFRIRGDYEWQDFTPKNKANLILTNHTTNWDFLYLGMAFKGHTYFVASEHIFRAGFVSKAIRFLVDPIARKKGASAIGTTKEILKRLKAGQNVCMMVEGNRSFTGETGFISPNAGALAKKSGAGLINFCVHGGYFVNPRWSKTVRKGKVWGEFSGEYSPEELKKLTKEEVADLINRDLYVDAFKDQEEKNYSYTCAAPAETLETALFACPDCGEFHSLKSSGDRLVCGKCGSEHIFTEKGFFERPDGSAPAFSTVLEWYRWEKEKLRDHLKDAASKEPFLVREDEGAQLYVVHPLEGKKLVCSGKLALYSNRMEVQGEKTLSFPLTDIGSMAIVLTNKILFTTEDNTYYEMQLSERASALHHLISYYFLTGREYER